MFFNIKYKIQVLFNLNAFEIQWYVKFYTVTGFQFVWSKVCHVVVFFIIFF